MIRWDETTGIGYVESSWSRQTHLLDDASFASSVRTATIVMSDQDLEVLSVSFVDPETITAHIVSFLAERGWTLSNVRKWSENSPTLSAGFVRLDDIEAWRGAFHWWEERRLDTRQLIIDSEYETPHGW